MEEIENSSIRSEANDEFIFNEDASVLSCNKEFDNYTNILSPQVVRKELENVDLTLQGDILGSFNNCGHTNLNIVDINQYNQSSGDKLNSASECGYDFDQEYNSFASADTYTEADENVRSTDSRLIKKHKKDNIIDEIKDDVSFLSKELNHDEYCDMQEAGAMIETIAAENDYEISNEESVNSCHLEERDVDCNSEIVACLDNSETINMSPKNCYIFSNEINEGSIFCQDAMSSGVKEVAHRHNECALANDFFETVENINLNISEKQNNLKDAIEKLVEVVKESDFENRINSLIEISDKNTESIEQFKKKSEDCIRQCRKFETLSENLIGDCVNTLAQGSVCYAKWVGLHASDLKQIDTDLEDIESFIQTSQ